MGHCFTTTYMLIEGYQFPECEKTNKLIIEIAIDRPDCSSDELILENNSFWLTLTLHMIDFMSYIFTFLDI